MSSVTNRRRSVGVGQEFPRMQEAKVRVEIDVGGKRYRVMLPAAQAKQSADNLEAAIAQQRGASGGVPVMVNYPGRTVRGWVAPAVAQNIGQLAAAIPVRLSILIDGQEVYGKNVRGTSAEAIVAYADRTGA